MTFITSSHIAESLVFYDVKFEQVTQCCSWNYESHFSSIDSLRETMFMFEAFEEKMVNVLKIF